MRRSKFTETQIVSILKRSMPAARLMNCGGSTASVPRPTTNGRRSTAGSRRRTSSGSRSWSTEQSPQAAVCRSLTRECGTQGCHCKKALRPAARREVVAHMVTGVGLPLQRACRAVGMGRAMYYRPLRDWARRDAPVIAALTTLVAANSCGGFWKCCNRLRLDGHHWNPKRLWRVYGQLQLNLPRRTKKRLPLHVCQPLVVVP